MTGSTEPLAAPAPVDRRSRWRGLLTSSLVGVVVGTVLGAVPTYIVAHDQIRAAGSLALRTQQQSDYVEFLADEQALGTLQDSFIVDESNDMSRYAVGGLDLPTKETALFKSGKA